MCEIKCHVTFCVGRVTAPAIAMERLFFIALKPLFFLFPESLVMLNDVLNQIESQNVFANPVSHNTPTSSTDINPVSKMHMLIIVLEDIPLA